MRSTSTSTFAASSITDKGQYLYILMTIRAFLDFLHDKFCDGRLGSFFAIAPIMIANLARAHDALIRPILLVRVVHTDKGGDTLLGRPVTMPRAKIILASIPSSVFEYGTSKAMRCSFKPLPIMPPCIGELQLPEAVEFGANKLTLVHTA